MNEHIFVNQFRDQIQSKGSIHDSNRKQYSGINVDTVIQLRTSCDSQFEMKHQIGQGANAPIVETCHKNDCDYVTKIIHKDDDQGMNELNIYIALQGTSITPDLVDAQVCNDLIGLVLRKCDGTFIDYVLLGLDLVVAVQQIGGLLANLHQHNIAHCDIVPSNIMYKRTSSGKYEFVLIDFGQSILFDSNMRGEEKLQCLADDWRMFSEMIETKIAEIREVAKLHTEGKLHPWMFLGTNTEVPVAYVKSKKMYPYWLYRTFFKDKTFN